MKMPFEVISGEILVESLFNANLITQGQYDRLNKVFDDLRNENNYVLLWLGEALQYLDETQVADVRNHIIKKANIQDIKNCYIAI